jgi:WD40 repeat protein
MRSGILIVVVVWLARFLAAAQFAPAADAPPKPALPEAARQFSIGSEHIESLFLAPDGKTLAVGSSRDSRDRTEHSVSLWDIRSGRLVKKLGSGNTAAYSPDGELLAWGGGWSGKVHLYDVDSGLKLRTVNGGMFSTYVTAFAPDSRTLLTFNSSGMAVAVKVSDTATGQVYLKTSGSYEAAAFRPDSKTVVLAADHTVEFWDIATGKKRSTAQLPRPDKDNNFLGAIRRLAYLPDGKTLLAVAGDGTIHRWRGTGDKEVSTVRCPCTVGHDFNSAALSGDGQALAVVTGDGGLLLVDAATGNELRTLAKPPQKLDKVPVCISAVVFGADGRTLISGANNGTVVIWDSGKK